MGVLWKFFIYYFCRINLTMDNWQLIMDSRELQINY